MEKISSSPTRKVKIVRRMARILGTLLIVPFLFLFMSSSIENHGLTIPDTGRILLSIFFILGQFGLLIAWGWEGIGSLLAFIGLVISILLELFWTKQGLVYLVFFIYLIPAFLFFYCWWQSRKEVSKSVFDKYSLL